MANKKQIAITISTDTRQFKAGLRRAANEVRSFERQMGGVANRMRRMRQQIQGAGIFGRAGGALRTAAGFAGVFGFQQLITEAADFDARLTDIGITGNLSKSKMKELRQIISDVGKSTGKSSNEIMDFVAAVTTATGDTGSAMEALKGMGEVAVATGADMGALGQVFVKLTTSMKILPREARQAFNILRSQEKMGAVTMADMARVMPEVIGGAGFYGKAATGLGGMAAVSGLMQIARRGTGSVDMAKTATVRFMQEMFLKRKNVKKYLGVDIMGEDGQVRDLRTVFGEVAVALGKEGALGKYGAKIWTARGLKTAGELAKIGQVGLGGKIGTLKSYNAIMGAGAVDEIAADARTRRESVSFQLNMELKNLKREFRRGFFPIFRDMVAGLRKWGPDLAKAIKFVFENSKNLIQLWIGWKGAQFFKRLLAPVAGQAAGGALMGTGGAVIPVGGGVAAGRAVPGIAGGVVAGGALLPADNRRMPWHYRARYSSAAMGSFDTAGVSDLALLQNEQRRRGRWMRYAGTGAKGGAFALGAASPFMGRDMGGPGDMMANMALMSMNPTAMIAGGIYKALSMINRSAMGKDTGAYKDPDAWYNMFVERRRGTGDVGLHATAAPAVRKMQLKYATLKGKQDLENYYSGTAMGVQARLSAEKLMGTFAGVEGLGDLGSNIGRFGITEMARQRGGTGFLKKQFGQIASARQAARAKALEALGPGHGLKGDALEAKLRSMDPLYARLDALFKVLDKLIADILSGKKINVSATVDVNTPAARLAQGGTNMLTGTPNVGVLPAGD